MQRRTRKNKAIKPKELTSEQLRQREAERIAYETKRDAYLAAQKPTVISQNPFDSLPSDVIGKISNEHLPRSDARRFAKAYPSLFSRERLIPVKARAETEVQQFLLHVMNANLKAAKEMLEIDPGLILEEYSVGEHKEVTALLLAKRMRDIGMCEMLLEQLRAYDVQCSKRFNCNVDRATAEIEKVRANTYKKAPLDVTIFDVVADAIAEHPEDVATELSRHRTGQKTKLSNAMDAYRAAIDRHGECTVEDMVNVFNAFVRNVGKFKNEEQYHLFFFQVIGYLARKLPVCLRMALNQGIWHMLRNNDVVNLGARTRIFVINNIPLPLDYYRYYSLVDFDLRPGLVLGFDFAFDIYGWQTCWRHGYCAADCFKNFNEQQNQHLLNLNLCSKDPHSSIMQPISELEYQPQPEEVRSSRCVIC